MRHTTILGITALAMLATAATAGHRGHDGLGLDRAEHRLDRMTELLDLSGTQREQMGAIFEDARQQRRTERDDIRAQREQLDSLLGSDAPDATEVGQLVIAMHERRQELRAEHERIREQMEALLTPEQLEKLEVIDEFRSQRREHRRDRRHGRMGHHGHPDAPGLDLEAQGNE